MQKEGQNNLYVTLKDYVPSNVLKNKNKAKSWKYGYDEKYDLVVISKTGEIGEIVSIQGLPIALPLAPKKVYKRSGKKQEQYWEREEIPKDLKKIQSIFQWNNKPADFKDRWVDYIESEFDAYYIYIGRLAKRIREALV